MRIYQLRIVPIIIAALKNKAFLYYKLLNIPEFILITYFFMQKKLAICTSIFISSKLKNNSFSNFCAAFSHAITQNRLQWLLWNHLIFNKKSTDCIKRKDIISEVKTPRNILLLIVPQLFNISLYLFAMQREIQCWILSKKKLQLKCTYFKTHKKRNLACNTRT